VIRSRTHHGVWLILVATVMLGLACGELEGVTPADSSEVSESDTSPYLGTTTSDEPPQMGGRLIYGLPAETNSWNPSTGQWAAYSMQVARALFDPLFLFDAEGNVQPNIVERTEHSPDYTEWTITIRPNVKFHDGTTVTADDILRTTRIYRESPVLGGVWTRSPLDGTTVLDDRTFRVRYKKPWPTFRESSTSSLAMVVDPDWLTESESTFRHDKPVGTGPFRIESWEPGKRLVATRNPDYWQKDRWGNQLPYLDRIEFQIVTSDQERLQLLEAGRLDVMMQTLTTPDLGKTRAQCRQGQLQCFSDEKGETPENLVVLNTSRAPLNNLDARAALAKAIDRDDFVRKITGGLTTPADSMYSSTSPWYTPTQYPNFDPAGAARLVERVKMKNRGVFRFELLSAATDDSTRIALYLQEAWRKVGIDVRISTLDNRTKIINQVTGRYDASLTQLFDNGHPTGVVAYVDPDTARGENLSLSFSRITDPELGVRIEELLRGDPEEGHWRAASARLVERVNVMLPFVWLDHAPRTFFARPNVVNITQAYLPDGKLADDFHLGSHALSQVWIKR
jgi:peptide/nickel transport system substrate-binding protein